MKKIFSLLMLGAIIVLSSCSKDAETKVSVTDITLDNTLSLGVGETKQLTAMIAPANAANKTVTWKSDQEDIAGIDGDGNAKGLTAGKTNITATANDGSGVKATCKVIVEEAAPQPGGATALSIGDFYMKDGTTVGKDIELTPEQKANCVGIVLKVGRDTDGNWKDDCEYKQKDSETPMKEIKGYVLALNDANNGNECAWGIDGEEEGTKIASTTGFDGYKNTQTIRKLINYSAYAFPAGHHALNYELVHKSPENSSGWFLPSAGQCQYWLENQKVLLTSVRKATDASNYNWKGHYWSSSEYDKQPGGYVWGLYFQQYENVYFASKNIDSKFSVRSLLVF